MAEKTPDSLFELYESHQFFYSLKDNDEFKTITDTLKNSLKHRLKPRLEGLLSDLAIVMESNQKHPRYSAAFGRYQKHYSGFSLKELSKFYSFIRMNYGVNHPKSDIIVIPMREPTKPSRLALNYAS
ncbi:hypothetical protein ACFLZ7_02540 [Nanoarchaeota archaeon]